MGMIISGFPGVGKSAIFKRSEAGDYCCDSDSSQFSWAVKDGNKIRNPEFPGNYVNHIREAKKHFQYVFVSTHAEVLDALIDADLCPKFVVAPARECKAEYLKRYVDRGSPKAFVDLLGNQWDSFLDQLHARKDINVVELPSGKFLLDVIKKIESKNDANKAEAAVDLDHSPLAKEIDNQIVRPIVNAYGLVLKDFTHELILKNIEAPNGSMITEPLKIMIDVNFEIKDTDDDSSARAKANIKKGIVTIRPKPKFTQEINGVFHVPKTTVYFDSYRAAIIHEVIHIVDAITNALFDEEKASTKTALLEKKTPEHRRAYNGSLTEIRSFINEICYIIEQRANEFLDDATQSEKAYEKRLPVIEAIMSDTPDLIIETGSDLKLFAPKFKTFIDNTSADGMRELRRRISILQASYKRRYGGKFSFHGS